jgi:hypothetical protein
MAPASTGKDNNNKTAVITTAHPNRASLWSLIPGVLIFTIVVMKLMAPNKLLTPDRCKANIARSTLGPLWLCTPLKGGYTVQAVPAPPSMQAENTSSNKLGGNNQKLMLLSLGKAMSGPPTIKGIKKLPNPPINDGITIKNIIRIAWAVIILLYNWLSEIYWTPGPLNSILIKTEKAVPNSPENNAKIKYNIPISLAFVDKNHLSIQRDIFEFKVWGSLFVWVLSESL